MGFHRSSSRIGYPQFSKIPELATFLKQNFYIDSFALLPRESFMKNPDNQIFENSIRYKATEIFRQNFPIPNVEHFDRVQTYSIENTNPETRMRIPREEVSIIMDDFFGRERIHPSSIKMIYLKNLPQEGEEEGEG